MLVNADFSRPASVLADKYQWVASPQGGVERVMLDRVGAEKARATSIVRYAPNSYFPRHQHPGGEEILVLSGTFSEEGADYPAGWYMRNPPGSSHQPSSEGGAVIFVKLWQMREGDDRHVRIDTRDPAHWRREGGNEVCPLFSSGAEQVALERIAPGAALNAPSAGGMELLVVTGEVHLDGVRYSRGGWIRLPDFHTASLRAGEGGATVYRKTGHLKDIGNGGRYDA